MDSKKVGTLRRSYRRADGQYITKDYQAELNNAVFCGNMTAMRGSFRGRFSASMVNTVSNPTIAGRATAISTVIDVPAVVHLPQNYWYNLQFGYIDIPAEDTSGGYLLVAHQFTHLYNGGNTHREEALRPYSERIVVNGQVINTVNSLYGSLWWDVPRRFHEYAVFVNSPGRTYVAIQTYFPDWGWNVHPHVNGRRMRIDYIRR